MKPVIIFTNFWDANAIIENGYFIFVEGNKLYRCRLISEKNKPMNYHVYSIALSHPNLKGLPEIKSRFEDLIRVNCFCPTYEMLNKYKSDKDWDSYTVQYRKLLKLRKDSVKEWMDILTPDTLYFLCCWENTIGESKCHRQLLYDALKKSTFMNDKAFFVYRHGDKENSINKWNVFNLMDLPIGQIQANVGLGGQYTVSVNPGTPVTIGSAGLAEALGLSVGDAIGAVTSSTSNGNILVDINSGGNFFNDLVNNLFANNASAGFFSSHEKDLDDLALGDDEGDLP